MKQFTRLSALLALALLMATTLSGQTTSALIGTATSDGAPLPGVTVTISSPNMQGTRTAVTGDAGGYNFGGIPPGEYTVRFDLAGMQSVTKRVRIGVAQTGRADADLKVAAVAEAITVTAAAPSVLETPSVSQNLSAKLVEDLPIARTPLDAAAIAPGVNTNTPSGGQLSISGSPGYDNLVMVNGVMVTENVRHQDLGLYIEDAIQETTILTGGISAEYGGFTGGVVNSITKSGGNEFSGSLRDSLTNPSWQERTPIQEANNTQLLDKLGQVYEGTLGGFIMRDRLWFFGAGRQTKLDEQFSLRTVPLGDATRSPISYVRTTDEKRYEGKLTAQITSKHNVSASYLDYSRTQLNSPFTTASYDLEQLSNRQDPRELISAHYSGVLTNNWMVEAQYSSMDWGVGWGSGSLFQDFVRGTIVRNRADGNARWNSPTFCGVCDKETRSNDGFNVKTNYFLSSRGLGNHSIIAGYEDMAEHRYANNYQSGSNFRFFVNSAQRINGVVYPTVTPGRAASAAFLVWTPIFVLQQNESDLGTQSLFVNDRWDLNEHWSFSLGVRYDKNKATDSSGNKVSDDSKIAPRLNATFDPLGNGRHRITGSYAQYASRIVDGIATAGSSAGSPGYIYFSYLGPAINPAGTPTDQLVDTRAALTIVENWLKGACNAAGQCGTANLELLRPNSGHGVPGFDARLEGQLASPYVDEWTIGYGAQWLSNFVTRVDYVSRDWKDFYAYRVDQTTPQSVDPLGIRHDVQMIENTDKIQRQYRGVQFQANWRPRRFNVGLNYTFSTLKGNDEQESATSGTVGNSPSDQYYPELSNYEQRLPIGYLAQDQRHRAKAWLAYDVPLPRVIGGLNISVLQHYNSGLPYSAVANIDVSPYFDTLLPANSRYATPLASRQYFFSERGEFRLDDWTATDLAVNYRYPIGRFEIFAQGEMLNVLNEDAVVSAAQIRTTVTTGLNTTAACGPSTARVRCQTFNPFTTTPVEGVHYAKAADFGQPINATASFQTPRLWRFSLGLRF